MKFIIATLLLAATAVSDDCNPLKSTTCNPNSALGVSFAENFKGPSQYFNEIRKDGLSYSDQGLAFTINKRFDNPTIKSNFSIMFGRVEVEFKASSGQGIVSSFYLQSDGLDEIDLEWTGGNAMEVQSNWFSKGETATWNRGGKHALSSSATENYHSYVIEYTKDAVTFGIDGNVVRTVLPNNGQGFPQTPMYIMAGIWAGGDPSNKPGTIEWSGGQADYSKVPFTMNIKSVKVADYSTGKQYVYTNQSGDWTSIKAVDGEVNGRLQEAQSSFGSLTPGSKPINSSGSSSLSRSTSSSSSSIVASSSSSSSSIIPSSSSSRANSTSSAVQSSTLVSSTSSSASISTGIASSLRNGTVTTQPVALLGTTDPRTSATSTSATSSAAPTLSLASAASCVFNSLLVCVVALFCYSI